MDLERVSGYHVSVMIPSGSLPGQAEAQAWLAANPTFESTYKDNLVAAAPGLYKGSTAVPADSFGIMFSKPIDAADTTESLQAALAFVTFERVILPGLSVPGWRVTGGFPVSRFDPGDDGQTVTVDGFDGTTLKWTVGNARLFCVAGNNEAVLEQMKMVCGRPMPAGSFWQIRQEIRGTLHFECSVSAAPDAEVASASPIS